MVKFLIHKQGPSRGARQLRKALRGAIYNGHSIGAGSVLINWGDSQCPVTPCLNRPEAIRQASNKRNAFQLFAAKGVPVPRFATSLEGVTWSGTTVVRHKLTGHSGEGIELVEKGKELPNAPLYVEYIKKEDEFRIHVGRHGDDVRIFSVQRKARRLDVPLEQINWQIRNHCNGFVFVRQAVNPPQSVADAAKAALTASGLDFGAVDVIYNTKEGKAYVLEINTAPGLEGQTIDDYAGYFRGRAGVEIS